jgi:hypothetical protein
VRLSCPEFSFISTSGSIISIKLVSGGPLIIPGASPEQDVQIGIVVSYGDIDECFNNLPHVFACVSNQLSLINKNVCSKRLLIAARSLPKLLRMLKRCNVNTKGDESNFHFSLLQSSQVLSLMLVGHVVCLVVL